MITNFRTIIYSCGHSAKLPTLRKSKTVKVKKICPNCQNEKTIKASVYWVKGVEVIETKEYPLGKALYFAENEAKIKMFPADELTQSINKGDKVDIQISFGRILTLKKTTRLYAKDMNNINEADVF